MRGTGAKGFAMSIEHVADVDTSRIKKKAAFTNQNAWQMPQAKINLLLMTTSLPNGFALANLAHMNK